MFIGFEVKSNQNQAKLMTLTTDIRLTQAVLDPASKGGNKKEAVCVVAEYNKKQFIVAVLDPNLSWQTPLDLMFATGTQVKFFLRGQGTVHITGYEHHDDLDDLSLSMSSDEDVEEDEEEMADGPARKKLKQKASDRKSPKANGAKSALKTGKGKAQVGGDKDLDEDDDDDDSEDLDFGSDDGGSDADIGDSDDDLSDGDDDDDEGDLDMDDEDDSNEEEELSDEE